MTLTKFLMVLSNVQMGFFIRMFVLKSTRVYLTRDRRMLKNIPQPELRGR